MSEDVSLLDISMHEGATSNPSQHINVGPGLGLILLRTLVSDSASVKKETADSLYTLELAFAPWSENEPEADPGDATETALDLGTLSIDDIPVSGFVSRTEDSEDDYLFVLDAPGQVEASLTKCDGGVTIQLFEVGGDRDEPIAGCSATSPETCKWPSVSVPAGKYLLRVIPLITDSASGKEATKHTLYTLAIHAGT